MIGVGSQYTWDSRDSAGGYLDGAKSYRLNLPANAPAKELLVCRRLRPSNPIRATNRTAVPKQEQREGRPDAEPRWFRRPVLRTPSPRWVREQLGPDRPRQRMVGLASVSTVPSNHGSTRLGGQARSSWSPTAQRKCRGSRSPWPLGLTADSARCGSVSKPPGPRPDHDLYRISAIECVPRLVRAPNRLAEDSHPGAPQTARIRCPPYGTRPVLCAGASTPSAWSSGAEEEPRVESTCACQPSLSMRARSSSASYMTLTTRYSEPSPRRRR